MTLVAGIFFADDYVIFGVATCHNERAFPALDFSDIAISRIKSSDNPYEDTDNAMQALSAYLNRNEQNVADINSIATASLGPHIAKQVGEAGHGIHLSGLRRPSWNDFDIVTEVKSHLSRKVQSKIGVYAYVDAEAMALGEYFLKFRPDDSDKAFNIPQETLAVLLADEGIGGAVIKRVNIFRGDMHTELGHMRVNVHKDDNQIDKTSKIGRRLTQLASLEAMRRRWNLSFDAYMNLPKGHDYLEFLGYYYGQAMANITMFYTPTAIKLTGRVFDHPDLLERIHKHYKGFSGWAGKNKTGQKILYPGYPTQQIPKNFITVSTNKDIGIIGCFCGAIMRADTLRSV